MLCNTVVDGTPCWMIMMMMMMCYEMQSRRCIAVQNMGSGRWKKGPGEKWDGVIYTVD